MWGHSIAVAKATFPLVGEVDAKRRVRLSKATSPLVGEVDAKRRVRGIKILLYSLLIFSILATKAQADITPEPTPSLTPTSDTATTQGGDMAQLMQQMTVQAQQVFTNVDYHHLSGQDKEAFFDDGGLNDTDSESEQIHSFIIPGAS